MGLQKRWSNEMWAEHNRKLSEGIEELRRLDAEEAQIHRSMIQELKEAFRLIGESR